MESTQSEKTFTPRRVELHQKTHQIVNEATALYLDIIDEWLDLSRMMDMCFRIEPLLVEWKIKAGSTIVYEKKLEELHHMHMECNSGNFQLIQLIQMTRSLLTSIRCRKEDPLYGPDRLASVSQQLLNNLQDPNFLFPGNNMSALVHKLNQTLIKQE